MMRLVTRSGRVGLSRIWTRLAAAVPLSRVADDPAHGVAGGDRSRTDELLSGFERDVGDLAGRRVDLIEGTVGVGIDLDGVDIAGAGRLHARLAVCLVDARVGIGRVARCGPGAGNGLELARQRQKLRQFHDLHGLGRIGLQHRLPRRVIVGDRRRLPGRAGTERGGGEQKGCERQGAHQPSSLDQLRAWT